MANSFKEKVMASWQLQDAKARFTKFLNTALKKGPQIVTRRGVETAVLVPIHDWRRLQQTTRPTLKNLLLAPGPRFSNLAPKRGALKRRKRVEFK
jgi:antitoxin Phd